MIELNPVTMKLIDLLEFNQFIDDYRRKTNGTIAMTFHISTEEENLYVQFGYDPLKIC